MNQKGDPQDEGALALLGAEKGNLPGTGSAQWRTDGEAVGVDV